MNKNFRLLRNVALTLATGLFLNPCLAQVVTSPRDPSPAAEVTQTVGLATVKMNYSRPSVVAPNGTDRTGKIYGTTVAHYGYQKAFPTFGSGNDFPWRAGANENTTITFSDNALVEGQDIAAGTYGLFMALSESGADVIFSRNAESWGSYFYDETETALKVTIQSEEIRLTKRLTYNFVDVTKNSAAVVLDWENRRFPFKVEFDVVPSVLASMRNELRSTGGFGWQGYNTAANYCLTNNTNLEEGLKWAEASIVSSSNFNNMNTKAKILTELGKTDEAKETMDLAMEQGNPLQIHQYGRTLIGEKKLDEAMKIFEYNSNKHENTWPVNVGLARGFSAKGDYKAALKYMQKALENAPQQFNKDNVQANIEKLKKGEDIN